MDVHEAIEKRRTIRTFKKEAAEEQLRRIILVGSKAPSGGNRQPWEFIARGGTGHLNGVRV
jgi:nitroreductase